MNLPKGWKLLQLKEICDLQNGYAFKSTDYVNASNTLNCRMSSIRPNGVFDLTHNPKFLPDFYAEKYSNYLLKDGDVIIAMTDMATEAKILGVPTIVKTEGKQLLLNQRVGKLIIKKPDLIFFPYLKYVLNRKETRLYFLKFSGGGLQINLGKNDLLSVKIPLPPIASQRRIADILDKADEIIRKRKEAIALTEQLQKSIFLDMFGDPVTNPKGWDVVTLEQVAEKEKGAIKCGPFGSQLLISEFQDIGIPVYGIDNVQKNEFIWAKPKFITREKYQQLRAFSIKSNDVLISRTGTVGRTCIAPPNIPESIIGANLLKVSLDQNKMSSKYLSYALSYSEFLIQEIKNISPGATVPVFNTSNLKSLKLANPPIDLQIKFNLIINKIQEKIGKQGKYLQESENLFNSLLQKAFKGEL
jgi:type I restriction enzyme S subunit